MDLRADPLVVPLLNVCSTPLDISFPYAAVAMYDTAPPIITGCANGRPLA